MHMRPRRLDRLPPVLYDVHSINLPTVDASTDLGVTYDKHFSFSAHIDKVVTKAAQCAKLILNCFSTRDPVVLMRAFNTYVRPILEYTTVVWLPVLKQDIRKLEGVQKRFSKRLSGMSNLQYEARLKALSTTSLEHRRIRNDLVTCYKYLNNMCEIGNLDSLRISEVTQTRGHSMKLARSFCRTGQLLHSFEYRVITVWNSLPSHIACSPSLVSFKKTLQRYDLSKFCIVFASTLYILVY